MKSVLQKDRECWCCGTIYNLHKHHTIFGTSNRKKSDKMGYWVYLCMDHHTGANGVHTNPSGALNTELHELTQRHYEKHKGTREQFIKEFGKSYL